MSPSAVPYTAFDGSLIGPLLCHIGQSLGSYLYNIEGYDDEMLSRTYKPISTLLPTVTLTSSELGGSSPGTFTVGRHEFLGDNIFPELSWTIPKNVNVQSWLLIVEDVDARSPVTHGLYYNIPAKKTSLKQEDFEVLPCADSVKADTLAGGFKFGENKRGSVWTGPRLAVGHGVHRYIFQLVGLKVKEIEAEIVSKEELVKDGGLLEGRIVCWGEYVASHEKSMNRI